MTRPNLAATVTAAILLVGCAVNVNPPLLFGDDQTFGLHLGNDTSAAGGSVSLGYKARSLAEVPLSVLQPSEAAAAIESVDAGSAARQVALSVFAVFENIRDGTDAGGAGDGVVRIGQVFATGVAAQRLTRGYECRLAPTSPPCRPGQPPAAQPAVAAAAPTAAAATRPPTAGAVRPPAAAAASPPPPADRPYQRPLVFARTDTVGIDIGGSLAEQGLRFVLGFDTRSLALIPPATQRADGTMSSLYGTGNGQQDSYSVLGQFKSNTRTRGLDLGLERYFATGLAARNLAAGMQATIAASSAVSAPKP